METSRPSSFGGSTSSRRASAESQASTSSSSASSNTNSKFINNTEDIFNTNFNCFGSSYDGVRKSPDTLLNIAARYVGEKFPFQLLEERFNRIPEPVQKRVIFHSFPRSERDIHMYSSFTNDSSSVFPYDKGLQILESQGGDLVSNVLQIGFHLSGTVEGLPSESKDCLALGSGSHGGKNKYRVSLSFDRCKITHCSCSCGAREIFWCEHIVALSLYRIRYATKVNLRVPISDQLLSLSRDQLQKLVQYIIADHQDVLPTAQNLTDQILTLNSDINSIQGAPDPTAGPSYSERHSWAFDEDQVKEQVRTYLSQATATSGISSSNYGSGANRQLVSLFQKVREMLNTRDSNAPRLLNLITYEFIADTRLHQSRTCLTPMTDKLRSLWDQLINLWVCICMNPHISDTERRANKKLLTKYANHPSCPMEDGYEYSEDYYEGSSNDRDRDPGSSSSAKRRRKSRPKSVFHRAIECLETRWELGRRDHIKLRDIPMECARVDALCSHGFTVEAVDVALSIVSHMKRFLRYAQDPKDPQQFNRPSYYGLLGHPLECHTPVFNALINSGHITQAFEFSLLTLGEWRLMPLGLYSQDKAQNSELAVITKLQDMAPLTPELEKVLLQTCSSLLHHSSGLGNTIHPGSYPMHTFAKYLFTTLQAIEPDLGHKIGLRALRLPFLEDQDGSGSSFFRRSTRWFILGQVENQQCNLASTMLNSARYDTKKLDAILECCNVHVHSPSHLFQLAKDCLKIGGEIPNTPTCPGGSSCIANITGPWPTAHSSWANTGSSSRWMASGASMGVPSTGSTGSSSSAAAALVNENAAHGSTWRATGSASWHSLPSAPASSPWGTGSSGSGGWSTSWGGTTKNIDLVKVGYKLGFKVLKSTLRWASRKRYEMVRWMVGCACEVGLEGILGILQKWSQLFTPAEAVGTVATSLMGINQPGSTMPGGPGPDLARIATLRSRLLPGQLDEIALCSRNLALECAKKDPPNCALSALGLCEGDLLSSERAYQIVVDSSANCLNSQQLFNIARYMEARCQRRAYKLALLAMENVHIGYNQDTHPAVTDIHWATSLYYSMTPVPVHTQFIQLIVKNVQCANVLSEILRRACSSRDKSSQLNLLKESTMNAYITTVHTRLTHISPRHYTDFIEFLSKAKESFTLAGDSGQFQFLTENIKTSYKGKKKLVFLVTERFG